MKKYIGSGVRDCTQGDQWGSWQVNKNMAGNGGGGSALGSDFGHGNSR